MDSLNVQSAGRKRGSKSIRGKQNRKLTRGGRKQKRRNKGGTFLADVSVPAGLLLLNQFMKHRKSKRAAKSRKTKSRKSRR
jgi:hypothetical protein